MNTSTEQGREIRMRVLEAKREKQSILYFKRKYKETGDKKYMWVLHNITGEGDNFPGPDSE